MSDYKQDFYNKYVTTHIADRKGDPTIDEFCTRSMIYNSHFSKFLPLDKSSQLLDVGCGNGSIVWWLQRIGYSDAMGIDISREQIEVGKGLGVQNLVVGNLSDLLKSGRNNFSIIISRDVIEHFNKQDVVGVLGQCHSALLSGGKLILQVPNGESPFFGRIRYGDFTHETAFTQSSLQQLLKIAKFSSVSCYPSGPAVTGFKSLIRVAAWKVLETMYRTALYIELGGSKSPRIVSQNIIAVATKA